MRSSIPVCSGDDVPVGGQPRPALVARGAVATLIAAASVLAVPQSQASATPLTCLSAPAPGITVDCLPGTYTIMVPTGSTSATVLVSGAGGSTNSTLWSTHGGNAAVYTGTITLPAGTTSLKLVVGAASATAGANGGGGSGIVAYGSANTWLADIVVAGGGGGVGSVSGGNVGTTGQSGAMTAQIGGAGGTSVAPGVAGATTCTGNSAGGAHVDGAVALGGGGSPNCTGYWSAGGGGGGYTGGGGGGIGLGMMSTIYAGGGGGGASYANPVHASALSYALATSGAGVGGGGSASGPFTGADGDIQLTFAQPAATPRPTPVAPVAPVAPASSLPSPVVAPAGSGWFAAVAAKTRPAAPVGVPARPGAVRGSKQTTQFNASANGTQVIPVVSAYGHTLAAGQGVTIQTASLFRSGSSMLTNAGKAMLVSLVPSFAAGSLLSCEGYADYADARVIRLTLSGRRAAAVCAYLENMTDNVTGWAVNPGGNAPAVVGTRRNPAINRRIVVVVLAVGVQG